MSAFPNGIDQLGKYKIPWGQSSRYRRSNAQTSTANGSKEAPVFKVLSIDGGGIRGVIPAVLLEHIEEKTKRP